MKVVHMSNLENITILLVEDNLGHSRLIQKNLKRSGLTNNVIAVSDGQQALEYLFSENFNQMHFYTKMIITHQNYARLCMWCEFTQQKLLV